MNSRTAHLLLRVGIAFGFIYAGISGFISPDNWIGYFPPFMQDLLPNHGVLLIWGVTEVILGTWILSGWKIFWPALLGGLSMIGVIAFNFSLMDILFRDVTIMLASLSLAISAREPKEIPRA
ncbi:MAG: hypothetical protein AB197_00850 [Parcubacteria bacterium C7867-002]|nr:MAG: hypothetical protein AB197_00850 [Parcubacteria bacterium C7867-002]